MIQSLLLASLLILPAPFQATSLSGQPQAEKGVSCESAELKEFDFLLGEWQGVERQTTPGAKPNAMTADVQITKNAQGCLLRENWTVYVDGRKAFGMFAIRSYEAKAKKWRLTYFGDDLSYEAWDSRKERDYWRFYREEIKEGKLMMVSVAWKLLAGDRFEQIMERSFDQGQTWTPRATLIFTRR